jgi:cytoskeleton protein RodZ
MTNFGASLKRARESKGLSLDQVAAETRISTRFLNAIENEDFNLLPGGIFNKGFVRAFAEKVGLNPDEMVAEYERLIGAPHPVDPTPAPAPAPIPQAAPVHKDRKGRSLYPVALVALIAVIGLFYILTRESGRTAQTETTPPQSQVAVNSPTPVPPPPEKAPSTESQTPPAQVGHPITLEIEAQQPTWIKVISDGNTVNAGEVLEPGMARTFTAQTTLKLSVGNAAGLNLKLNDKSMKPLGRSGQVREVTITPDTAKDFTG